MAPSSSKTARRAGIGPVVVTPSSRFGGVSIGRRRFLGEGELRGGAVGFRIVCMPLSASFASASCFSLTIPEAFHRA